MKGRQFVSQSRLRKFGVGEIQIRKVARKELTFRKKNKIIRRIVANGRFFTRHPAKTGTKRITEASPDRDKVGLASKECVKVNFKIFQPFLRAVIGLENGSKEVEVLLGGVGNAYSLKALGREAERDFTLDQTPEENALHVMGKVVFTAVAASENARKGNQVMVESSAGGPRVDPGFDYLKCFMFPKFFESFEGTAKVERGTGVKLEREKLGNSIGAKILKVIRESMSKKIVSFGYVSLMLSAAVFAGCLVQNLP